MQKLVNVLGAQISPPSKVALSQPLLLHQILQGLTR